MKITAQDLHGLGVVDVVVPEPLGGAHRDRAGTISVAGDHIEQALAELKDMAAEEVRRLRREKFLDMGKMPA